MSPRKTSKKPGLPWKVVAKVINFVSEERRETLRALCLTSRAAYSEASRLLHRSFSNKYDTPQRHIKRLRLLVSNPGITRLASLIQSYDIDVSELDVDRGCFDDSPNAEVAEMWMYIPRALTLMVNLKRLRYVEDAEWQMPRAQGLSMESIKFQLEELHWELFVDEDVGFAKFLEIARDACQNLVYVEGPLSVFHKVLPGRPNITQIRWITADGPNDDGSSLEGKFERITHLSLSPNILSNDRIEELFPSLLYLELDASTFLSKDSDTLGATLSHLRVLVLSNSSSRPSKRIVETAHSLLKRYQSLQEIFIDSVPGTYTRYEHSKDTIVSSTLKWTGNGKPRLSTFERAGPDNQLAEWTHAVDDSLIQPRSRPSHRANMLGTPGTNVGASSFNSMATMVNQHYPTVMLVSSADHQPGSSASAGSSDTHIVETPSTVVRAAASTRAQRRPLPPRRTRPRQGGEDER